MTDRLSAAFEKLARKIGTTQKQLWKLGRGDGSGTVQNLSDPFARTVWIYRDQSGEGREISSAQLGSSSGIIWANVAAYENIEVDVAYQPSEDRRTVISLSAQTGQAATGGILPIEQALQAAAVPVTGNLATMRVDPSSYTSPTLVCNTTSFFYTRPSDGQLYFQPVATLDFTTVVGLIAAGKQRYAWAWYDYESAVWGITSSTDQTPSVALPTKGDFTGVIFATLVVPSTAKRSVGILLYFGQTGIGEANFYRNLDPRLDFALITEITVSDVQKRIWLGI